MATGERTGDLPFIVSVWSGDSEKKKTFFGTGTLINATTVLTCKHVAVNAQNPAHSLNRGNGSDLTLWVSFPESARGDQRVVGSAQSSHDVAFITLESSASDQGLPPLPTVVTEITDSAWTSLKLSRHFSNCRVQGYPQSERGSKQYYHLISSSELRGVTFSADTAEIVRQKLQGHGVENGMSGSPFLIQKDDQWYLVGMAYLGGEGSTDSVIYSTKFIEQLLEQQSVGYSRLTLEQFLNPSDMEERHRAADERRNHEMRRILQGAGRLCEDLGERVKTLRGLLVRPGSAGEVVQELNNLSLQDFVKVFRQLDKRYANSGSTDEQLRNDLSELYWTGVAKKLPQQLIRECRELLQKGSGLPILIPIPSRTRAMVGVVMAGVEGRRAQLAKSPRTRNVLRSALELSLENLPESGVHEYRGQQEDGAQQDSSEKEKRDRRQQEVLKVIAESLGLRGLLGQSPEGWLQSLDNFFKSQIEDEERIFAVVKGWSEVLEKEADHSEWVGFLGELFPDLVWVDMTTASQHQEVLDAQSMAMGPTLSGQLQPRKAFQ